MPSAPNVPKKLETGDKVVFIVKRGDAEYLSIKREFRDTWLEGTVRMPTSTAITVSHDAFPSGIAVWTAAGNKGTMIVVRKTGRKLQRNNHLYKASQQDKDFVVASLRNKKQII